MSTSILNPHPLVQAIRDASRQLVRELGFMKARLAGTDLPPSAVHAIFEIGGNQSTTAASLRLKLNADETSVRATLLHLIQAGEVVEGEPEPGLTGNYLSLTPAGWKTLAKINAYAQEQVTRALNQLAPACAESILVGLRVYARALQSQRLGQSIPNATKFVITSGYRPGVIARTLEMQMQYYGQNWGFGSLFESALSKELGDLCSRLDRLQNEVWVALDGDKIVGTVFIDGEHLESGKAQLRAFIVDASVHGSGIGRRLIQSALAFSDNLKYAETHLFTFKGLLAARQLYISCGFVQRSETVKVLWGKDLTVHHFIRKLVTNDEPS